VIDDEDSEEEALNKGTEPGSHGVPPVSGRAGFKGKLLSRPIKLYGRDRIKSNRDVPGTRE
jgi:hypothetical protein